MHGAPLFETQDISLLNVLHVLLHNRVFCNIFLLFISIVSRVDVCE